MKRFERSNGLDTALYIKTTFTFPSGRPRHLFVSILRPTSMQKSTWSVLVSQSARKIYKFVFGSCNAVEW